MIPFHLAFPVDDLEAARGFYHGLLGCTVGRESARWIDFDFFGHQIVAHLSPEAKPRAHTNPVDGHAVPVPKTPRAAASTARLPRASLRVQSQTLRMLLSPVR